VYTTTGLSAALAGGSAWTHIHTHPEICTDINYQRRRNHGVNRGTCLHNAETVAVKVSFRPHKVYQLVTQFCIAGLEESSPANPTCTRTLGGQGFAPDPTWRAYSAPQTPTWWIGGALVSPHQEPTPVLSPWALS